jgi:hypothetical protein
MITQGTDARLIDKCGQHIEESDDAAEALRYLVATKTRRVVQRKLRGF